MNLRDRSSLFDRRVALPRSSSIGHLFIRCIEDLFGDPGLPYFELAHGTDPIKNLLPLQ
jgi:hypothetical protein